MAIGKAGAYATVEGPKVDFGDIALNAQKIQQADLDRMKSMIPEKEKEKEIKPLSIDEKTSTLGTFEDTSYKVAESARDGYYQSMKSGDPIAASRFETVIKRLNGSKEVIKAGSDAFLKDFSENKISGIESAKIETINNFRDRRNATGGVSENGTLYMQIFDKDENGDILMQDGKPVFKKIRVGDKLVSEITEDQLPTYLVDYVKSNDVLEESKKFATNTGANKTSVENGNVTIEKTKYTDENLKLLRKSVSSKLRSDRKYFEDIWYQSNPSKNNSRKMPSEYTEEDYKEAEDFLYNQTRMNFDTSYSKSFDEPKEKGGDGPNKNKVFTSNLTVDDVILYDGKLKQKFNKGNFSSNAIGISGIKPYNSPGLGYNIPEFVAYDKKNKFIVVGGSVVTDTNIRFTRDDGSKSVINDIEDLNPQEQDRFIQSTFGNKDKTTNFLRRPTAAMKTKILEATGFKNWSDLEKYFSSGNVGNIR